MKTFQSVALLKHHYTEQHGRQVGVSQISLHLLPLHLQAFCVMHMSKGFYQ